ncbi:hypothetical protein Tco_1015922 [Tanacetum coccineum]|uniref:Reverse transcriptase domain-containing protein n=1 Tax=Tanacetum coccineum TaxID=301880 RepID=A0ABQ5FM91_9ASTR
MLGNSPIFIGQAGGAGSTAEQFSFNAECPAADGYTQEAVYATTGAGSLPCNTIAYTRGYVKAITTKVVLLIVTFDSNILLILSRKWNLDECLALADLGASINLNALSVWETAFSPDNCEPCMILGIRRTMVVIRKVSPKMFLTTRALIDVYGEELILRVDDEAITFKVGQTSRYSRSYETVNQVNVIDIACEEYAQKVTFFLDKLLNGDPSPTLPPMKNDDLKQVDVTMMKPSIEEPPELELKDLPSHLEYAFLEGTDKLSVIIS